MQDVLPTLGLLHSSVLPKTLVAWTEKPSNIVIIDQEIACSLM